MTPTRTTKTCRSCGSVNTRSRDSMYTAAGDHLRWRYCFDCREKWGTIEVDLPVGVSPYLLSQSRKYRNRMRERVRRGYHGPGLGGSPLKPEPRVAVTVKVRAA